MARLSKIPPASHLGSKRTNLYTDVKDVHSRIHDSSQDLRDKWANAKLNFGVPMFRRFYLLPFSDGHGHIGIIKSFADSHDLPPKEYVIKDKSKRRLEKTRIPGDGPERCPSYTNSLRFYHTEQHCRKRPTDQVFRPRFVGNSCAVGTFPG